LQQRDLAIVHPVCCQSLSWLSAGSNSSGVILASA
jgi:hypothetical protein